MKSNTGEFCGLTGNQLKIVGLITMTCDHIGRELLLEQDILKVIGRLAFPIFAYMIAEGCIHTSNKKKYLLSMVCLAILCQTVYYVAIDSLYQCVLVTFSLSIGLIFVVDNAINKKTIRTWALVAICFVGIYFISVLMPRILSDTDFAIDYGFWGILLPLFVYIGNKKGIKLLLFSVALVALCLTKGELQWFSLFAILLLMLYNGNRGKLKIKNLFYVYYPAHIVCIYAIGLVI